MRRREVFVDETGQSVVILHRREPLRQIRYAKFPEVSLVNFDLFQETFQAANDHAFDRIHCHGLV